MNFANSPNMTNACFFHFLRSMCAPIVSTTPRDDSPERPPAALFWVCFERFLQLCGIRCPTGHAPAATPSGKVARNSPTWATRGPQSTRRGVRRMLRNHRFSKVSRNIAPHIPSRQDEKLGICQVSCSIPAPIVATTASPSDSPRRCYGMF